MEPKVIRKMFSRRFAWDAGTNALGRLMEEKRTRGCKIYDLTQSNPTVVGLTYPADAILASLSGAAAMTYAPDPRGLPAAREAIAGYYRGLGWPLDVRNLFLTASTSEAYAMVFKLLGDPGDEIRRAADVARRAQEAGRPMANLQPMSPAAVAGGP